MTQLYLVRHGQTQWSMTGQYTSVSDIELTDEGRVQAERLRTRLNPADFGLVLSSPRRRACATAELAGFTPEIDPNLAEWFYGDFEGMTPAQINQVIPDWQIWHQDPPGGETATEVVARFNRVVTRVRDSGVDKAICFSHGHALRVLALCWIGLDVKYGGSFPLDTASVSVLGADQSIAAILRWNT
ncbi:MAG: histidine phosphatase family protein [Propionibacteriaceae bacterium]|jgi:probable phosphoglycerate mutase|nr:histidine phosphatase family protein [Propionibacteriaceae bacterium]